MVDAQYREHRATLPAIWQKESIAAGSSGTIGISGIAKNRLPLIGKASVVRVMIGLTEPVTAGYIEFEAIIGGVATGQTIRINAAHGVERAWVIAPGKLTLDQKQQLGFTWSAGGGLLPDGTIEAILYVEVQWA